MNASERNQSTDRKKKSVLIGANRWITPENERERGHDAASCPRPTLMIALIGCGQVGTAIALGLKRAGHRIVWVKDIDPKTERRAAELLLGEQRARSKEQKAKRLETGRRKAKGERRNSSLIPSPFSLIDAVSVILIATPDAEIEAAYRGIEASLSPNQTVLHFSGALSTAVFGVRRDPTSPGNQGCPVRRGIGDAGWGVLAMHPVMTFPAPRVTLTPALSPQRGGGIPKGTSFSLEGNRKGLVVGRRLVRDLGGKAFVIRAEDKPLFHAACVFVSNFLDALIDAGIELCAEVGLEPKTAYRVLEPLIQQTLRNIAESGTAQALSGPIERGDIETVRKHLAALSKRRPELVQLYEALAAQTLTLAVRKKNRRH